MVISYWRNHLKGCTDCTGALSRAMANLEEESGGISRKSAPPTSTFLAGVSPHCQAGLAMSPCPASLSRLKKSKKESTVWKENQKKEITKTEDEEESCRAQG